MLPSNNALKQGFFNQWSAVVLQVVCENGLGGHLWIILCCEGIKLATHLMK